MIGIFTKIKQREGKIMGKNWKDWLHVTIPFIEIDTILSLKQLITICTITKHNDLIVHSVLALGYLLQLIYAAHDKNDKNDSN